MNGTAVDDNPGTAGQQQQLQVPQPGVFPRTLLEARDKHTNQALPDDQVGLAWWW